MTQLEDLNLMMTREAAAETETSVQWIARLIRDGKLQAISTRAGYLIPRAEVERLVEERKGLPRDIQGRVRRRSSPQPA